MSKGIVFLMYHEVQSHGRPLVDESPGYRRYVVSQDQFASQLDIVEQAGFKSLNVSQSLESLHSGTAGTPLLCITFDDGCASDLHVAAPLLRDKKFNATFYVTVDHLGRDGYLTKAELRELSDLGFEIGSHSLTHRHLNDLGAQEIKSELVESKHALEQVTGKSVDHFSCPGGRVNAVVAEMALEAGYKSVATSQLGINSARSHVFALKRVAIKREMNLKTFARVCSGRGQFLMKSEDSLLGTGKRLLGNERYDRLRANLLALKDRSSIRQD